MLSEQVIEYRTVLLVDSLHFVYVFGNFFHAFECLCYQQNLKVHDMYLNLLIKIFFKNKN